MINFSKYSDIQLEQSLTQINAEKYPENYQACKQEIDKRKAEGRWVSHGEYISSRQAGVVGLVLIIFQGFGVIIAATAVLLLYSKRDWAQLIFLFFALGWNFISFRFLKRFFSRCQNVSLTNEGLNVFSIKNEQHSFVPFSDIQGIKLFSCGKGFFGPHGLFLRTNTQFHFGQEFYFILQKQDLLESDFNIQSHPDYKRIADAVKKFNSTAEDTYTGFLIYP